MSYHQHRALVDTQSVDPLGLAREIAEETGLGREGELGYGLALLHRRRDLVQAICSENDDIHYDMDIEPCLRVLAEEGFDVVEIGEAKSGRFWLMWHPQAKLLGQLTSHRLFENREKLNSLNLSGQFTGDEAMAALRKDGYGGGGTVSVRRSDLQDVHVRDWNIRDGLRHFMHSFQASGAVPVDAWVNTKLYLYGEKPAALAQLGPEALSVIEAQESILAISELRHYGK